MFRPGPQLPPIGTVITQARTCVKCSYSLVGLKSGDRCPECGTPIQGAILRGVPGLADASLGYLKSLAWHAMLVAIGSALGFVGLLWLLGFARVPQVPGLAAVLFGAGTGLWAWGSMGVLVARELPSGTRVNVQEERRGFRQVARAMQWSWPLAGVIAIVLVARLYSSAGAGTPVSAMVWVGVGVIILTCLMAAALLLAQVAFLSSWANDTALADSCVLAPLMMILSIPAGLVVDAVAPTLAGRWLPVFSAPFLLVIGGVFLYTASYWVLPLVRFANLTRWAVRNGHAALDKNRRLSEKIVKRIEDGIHRPGMEKAPAPKAAAPGPEASKPVPASPVADGLYELAPEEP